MQKSTWILVANASQATLYQSINLGQNLELTKNFTHPQSREKGLNLNADSAGRFEKRSGEIHGAFVEKTDPKVVEAERFAIELARELDNGRTTNQFDRLVVIAPASFQGLLDKHNNHHVKQLMINQIDKDYTQMNEGELNNFLAELPKF